MEEKEGRVEGGKEDKLGRQSKLQGEGRKKNKMKTKKVGRMKGKRKEGKKEKIKSRKKERTLQGGRKKK